MTLPARQITSRVGVVIECVDISAEPSGEVIAVLRGALNEHKVIVFDGSELDVDRRSRQLVGDVSHYPRILEAAA
jgi:alpha-ketoglutarate-dependent sulfate ester dioxygenase